MTSRVTFLRSAFMPAAFSPNRRYFTGRGGGLIGFIALASLLGGCAGGAPSLVIFGAYFPAWLLSFMIGVCGALVARAVIVKRKLDTPYLLFVCVSVGVMVGSLFWFLFFGR